MQAGNGYFNSLPHTEVDRTSCRYILNQVYFNSLPHTEVDDSPANAAPAERISTHYLTQRQTFVLCLGGMNMAFQLTTSHRGRLEIALKRLKIINISTHYLTQRQTKQVRILFILVLFQLTTSHRGRRCGSLLFAPVNPFQLTTSHRGRRRTLVLDGSIAQFQLTTSHRGRLIIAVVSVVQWIISTHYLTQRQTIQQVAQGNRIYISTHYLTQRQTHCMRFHYILFFISTHYLTQRQTCACSEDDTISLQFQLTTSHRGRLEIALKRLKIINISTHYLTQRQTLIDVSSVSLFFNFNSLPHTEVDQFQRYRKHQMKLFQLTTSHRGRPIPEIPKTLDEVISTHYLTQRQTVHESADL